jgi:hypothetical protein
MRRLAVFFEEHADEAYSLDELWEWEFNSALPAGYRAVDRPLAERQYVYAIDKLVEAGVIIERHLGPTAYYSIGRVPLQQLLNNGS